MKKSLKSLVAGLGLGLGLAALSATASATPWISTYDPTDVKLNEDNSITWTHNLLIDGFRSGIDLVTSFSLKVFMRDDSNNDGSERAEIDLIGTNFGGTFDARNDATIFGNIGANLNFLQDGLVTIKLTADRGDFYFEKSVLTAQGTVGQVPEPGMLALLGLGFAGLAFTRRRRQ